MDDSPHDQVFSGRRVRAAFLEVLFANALLVPLAAAIGGLVGWLLSTLFHPGLAAVAAIGAFLGTLLVGLDYVYVGWTNRRWRRALERKLRRIGELRFRADAPDVYFVGLAHPCQIQPMRLESDDDIGFLRLTFDGIEYHGDRLLFDVPYEAIESIELEPLGYGFPGFIKRIRVRFTEGEPFDEVLLCGREGNRLSSANGATHTLYEVLLKRWERRSPTRLRAIDLDTVEETIDEIV